LLVSLFRCCFAIFDGWVPPRPCKASGGLPTPSSTGKLLLPPWGPRSPKRAPVLSFPSLLKLICRLAPSFVRFAPLSCASGQGRSSSPCFSPVAVEAAAPQSTLYRPYGAEAREGKGLPMEPKETRSFGPEAKRLGPHPQVCCDFPRRTDLFTFNFGSTFACGTAPKIIRLRSRKVVRALALVLRARTARDRFRTWLLSCGPEARKAWDHSAPRPKGFRGVNPLSKGNGRGRASAVASDALEPPKAPE
jgi:hypothetical protein